MIKMSTNVPNVVRRVNLASMKVSKSSRLTFEIRLHLVQDCASSFS